MSDTPTYRTRSTLDDVAAAPSDSLRLFLLAIPALWALGYLFPPMNHDVGALLQFSQRMLDGERLYVDLIDINPPMVFVLNLVPALLSRLTGIAAPTCFVLSVLAASLASLMLCRPLFDRLAGPERPLARLLVPMLALFALFVMPAHSFGQRGHLLFIFILPYLTLAALRLCGASVARNHAVAIGAFAALGVLLKPHFTAIPLLVELTVLAGAGYRHSLRDASPWVILAACFAYVGAVLLWLPAYFGTVVPMVGDYYAGFEPGALQSILLGDQVPAILLPLLLLGGLALVRRDPMGGVLAAAILGAVGAGIAQGKGWDYHFLTARQLLLILAATQIAGEAERLLGDRIRSGVVHAGHGIAAAALALVFFLSGALAPPFKGQQRFADSAGGRLLPIVKAHAEGRPVMWLTTSIYPQFPVLNYTDSKIASHFMSLWLLPAIYQHAKPTTDGKVIYTPPERMGAAEKLVFETTATDLVKYRPPLVIIEQASTEGGFHGLPFDYLDYFRRDPRFEKEWSNYRLLSKLGTLAIYRRR